MYSLTLKTYHNTCKTTIFAWTVYVIYYVKKNFDRNKSTNSSITPNQNFPVQEKNNLIDLVAAFISKTPHPPNYSRPFRYRRFGNRFGRRPHWKNNNNNRHRQLPGPLAKKFGKKLFYGCKQEGHFLRDCPEKKKYMRRLEHLKNVGYAAIMLIDSELSLIHI